MPCRILSAALPVAVALAGCWPATVTGSDVPVFPDGTTRILFIGNSLTYVEDVPGRVMQVARQYGDTTVRVATIAAPDYALIDHWSSGAATSALRRGRWEFVVMQQGPSSLPENQLLLRQWSALFAPAIAAAGGTPVLYGIWPHRARAIDMPAVETSYFTAAREIMGEFAPAGSAWYRALAIDPTLPLYARDGLHASPLGAWFAALVITSRVLGRDPRTLPAEAPGLSTDSATVRLLQRVAADVLRELDSTPDPTSRVLSADTTVFPEGMAADPRDGTLYVTSIAHRAVYRRTTHGAWQRLAGGPSSDFLPPVAIALDTLRDRLVVATGAAVTWTGAPASARSELLVFRPGDGALVSRVPLGDGRVQPGDLVVLPDGGVIVSDGTAGMLHVWPRLDAPATRLTHPRLRSPQGMVPTADGRTLYVADWSSGLLAVTLATGEVERLAVPDGGTLAGLDGLTSAVATDGSPMLIGVQNGVSPARLVAVELLAPGRGIRRVRELDRPARPHGEPTAVVVLRDTAWYLTSSHWPFRAPDGTRRQPDVPLPPVAVRLVPLRPETAPHEATRVP